MKISKYNFVKVLAKHIQLKINKGQISSLNDSLAVASFLPLFNMYSQKLINAGIMDEDHRIDYEILTEKINNFFLCTPIINIPIAGTTVSLTQKDAEAFLKDLENYGEIDQVIYLSYAQ